MELFEVVCKMLLFTVILLNILIEMVFHTWWTELQNSERKSHTDMHILLNQLSSYIILYFVYSEHLTIHFILHSIASWCLYIFTMFLEIVVGESPCTLLRLCRNKSEINPMGGRIKTFWLRGSWHLTQSFQHFIRSQLCRIEFLSSRLVQSGWVPMGAPQHWGNNQIWPSSWFRSSGCLDRI